MFVLIQNPRIVSSGKPLYNAEITKGDTVIAKFRVGGNTTGATIKVTGRLRDDSFKTTVFSNSSATPSEVLIEQTNGAYFSDVTLHIASANTAGVTPGTWVEYDIEIQGDVSYGTSPITISPATFTIGKGQFKVVDQVTT